MFASLRRAARRVRLVPLALMAGVGLGGWDEDELHYRYRAHGDTVTRGAGNAAASNIAIQTINPWPNSSRRTQIDQNGARAHIAIKRYETNTSIVPRGLNRTNELYGNGYNLGPAAAPPR